MSETAQSTTAPTCEASTSAVRVVVSFLEAGLMHMSVAVLGSVVVSVGVLVLDVLVFVSRVRVGMSDPAVLVLV
jgi:hypothetical protein